MECSVSCNDVEDDTGATSRVSDAMPSCPSLGGTPRLADSLEQTPILEWRDTTFRTRHASSVRRLRLFPVRQGRDRRPAPALSLELAARVGTGDGPRRQLSR